MRKKWPVHSSVAYFTLCSSKENKYLSFFKRVITIYFILFETVDCMVFTHGEGESNLLIPQHMFTVLKIDTACSLS